jgi:peroxiredoxin
MRPFLPVSILLFWLSSLSAQAISYDEALQSCAQQRDEIYKQNEATGDRRMLRATCLTGAMLPSFTAKTMDGKTIDSTYFKGKVTILSFWMKTCGPCIAEIPGLDKIKEKFGTDKVNYLAIGRCDEADAEAFLKLHPWSFEQVSDGLPLIENVFRFMWGYPVNMIIDKKGEIVMCFNGGFPGEWAVQHIQDELVPKIEEELEK